MGYLYAAHTGAMDYHDLEEDPPHSSKFTSPQHNLIF